jgi:hypothetical protein
MAMGVYAREMEETLEGFPLASDVSERKKVVRRKLILSPVPDRTGMHALPFGSRFVPRVLRPRSRPDSAYGLRDFVQVLPMGRNTTIFDLIRECDGLLER